MKKIVIAFIVLVLMIAATVGIAKFMQIGPFEPAPAEDEVEQKEKKLDAENLSRLEMDGMLVNVFNDGRIASTFQVNVVFEVERDRLSELNAFRDKVRDAVLTDLHSFVPRMLRQTENLDVQVLGDRIKLVAERYMGKGAIYQVLITSVVNTPL